ncbi:histone-lysine N-methyltransferase SETMAR [Trichonephila clavipes]|nr:histone-lysine N-methyltransferase SETMAR [Trichonephila clavipes]
MMDRISICDALVKQNKINPFLMRMVTGIEKWVIYDNIMQKRSWLQLREAAQTGSKPGMFYCAFGEVLCSIRTTSSIMTLQKLRELGWEVLLSLPCSPDLVQNDYHVFLTMENFIRDKKLASSRKVCENRFPEFYANRDQDFYSRDIVKIPLQ